MVLQATGDFERRMLAAVGVPAALAPYRTRGPTVNVGFVWMDPSIVDLRLDAVTGEDFSGLTCVHTQLGQICGTNHESLVQAARYFSRLRMFSSTSDGVVHDGGEQVLAGP